MFLAKVSIDRPIATTMGILVFIIFGFLAWLGINLNRMPDVEVPYVTVQTVYPGAGPKEIESLITDRIEESISTISQIEKIDSYSLDGFSIVIIEFNLNKSVDVANQEVKDKVDAIANDLPTDAQEPIIEKVDIRAFPIIDVVLSGDVDPRTLFEIADKTLRDRFSQIEGVARVDIVGGQERDIRVVLDNKTIFENYISLPQLMQILAAQNMNIPGGYFQINDQEFTVRLEGEYETVSTLNELQVPTPFGYKKLGQIADVIDGGKDIRQRATYFNAVLDKKDENVVKIGIIKSVEGNEIEVAKAIREAVPDIARSLPEGVNLEIVNDRSTFTQSTVDDTMSNIYLGILFTSIILFIFLTNIRSTIIVALSMPTSIISTFMLLQAAGLTLNMMTLMGISVSIGVLVANSVVVLENIFRHKKMGKDKKDAAYIGTKEVTVAVIAATLTNLVVFLPILNMSSMVGRFMKELALAASFATIFSLIFSFTLTPMLASFMLPREQKEGRIAARLNRLFSSWDEGYRNILRRQLKSKSRSWMVIAVSFLAFIGTMMYYGPKLGFEFMPSFDDGKIKIEVELPEGYNLSETAAVMQDIEDRIKQYPEVVYLLTNLGKMSDLNIGPHLARTDVQLNDAKERDKDLSEYISEFKDDLATVPNAKITVDYSSTTGPGGAPIQFFLMGQDLDVLDQYKDSIMTKISDMPGLINFDQSSRSGKPELTVKPIRENLADAGITTQQLALTLRATVEGMESSKYREGGNEYDITLTVSDEAVNTPYEIGKIPVVSQKGVVYKLSELADITFTTGYSKILHRDKFTAILFTGSPATGVPLGNVVSEIERRLDTIELPAGYKTTWGGNAKMMQDMVADMIFAFFLAVVLTYMLLAAILESFVQPVFILLTIPLAMIGVFIFLYYTNVSFGITSLMGIIMLIGIVVNNAILMLDYTNQLVREEGMSKKDALIQACPTKLKPILMSTLALILGMLPMAIGIGDAGKEMRIPLGVVSIGGLLVSAFLTLFVIPAFYYVVSKKEVKN